MEQWGNFTVYLFIHSTLQLSFPLCEGCSLLGPSQVQLKTSDAKLGNPDFTIHFLDAKSGDTISPWHDISLFSEREGCFNMLNEIPRYTTPKMEVATKMEFNPIVQDEKKGKLRNYHGLCKMVYIQAFSFCDS